MLPTCLVFAFFFSRWTKWQLLLCSNTSLFSLSLFSPTIEETPIVYLCANNTTPDLKQNPNKSPNNCLRQTYLFPQKQNKTKEPKTIFYVFQVQWLIFKHIIMVWKSVSLQNSYVEMPTPKGGALGYMISAIYPRDSTKHPSPFCHVRTEQEDTRKRALAWPCCCHDFGLPASTTVSNKLLLFIRSAVCGIM